MGYLFQRLCADIGIVTTLSLSTLIESALRHSIRPEFSRPRFEFPAKKPITKELKKACQNFLHQ